MPPGWGRTGALHQLKEAQLLCGLEAGDADTSPAGEGPGEDALCTVTNAAHRQRGRLCPLGPELHSVASRPTGRQTLSSDKSHELVPPGMVTLAKSFGFCGFPTQFIFLPLLCTGMPGSSGRSGCTGSPPGSPQPPPLEAHWDVSHGPSYNRAGPRQPHAWASVGQHPGRLLGMRSWLLQMRDPRKVTECSFLPQKKHPSGLRSWEVHGPPRLTGRAPANSPGAPSPP